MHEFVKVLLRHFLPSMALPQPFYLEDSGLSPIITVEYVLELACELFRTHSSRIKLVHEGESITHTLSGKILNPAEVIEQSREHTLVIESIHHDYSVLKSLCQELGSLFRSFTVPVNAYLGIDNSRGSVHHADNSDVLIWQQAGEKQWTIGTFEFNGPTHTRVTQPGGIHYYPKGLYHCAKTLAEVSLHVVFGPDVPDRRFIHYLKDQAIIQGWANLDGV